MYLAYETFAYSLIHDGVSEGLQDVCEEPGLEFAIRQLSGLLEHLIRQLLVDVPYVRGGQPCQVTLQAQTRLLGVVRDGYRHRELMLRGLLDGLREEAVGA